MKTTLFFSLFLFLTCVCNAQKMDQIWPQFRGLDGSGVAVETSRSPIVFDESNLLWKTELPQGVSSPIIWKNKLFITGFIESNKELQTICINTNNGKLLWSRSVNPDTIEKYSTAIASPAQSTLTSDGERVISFFGSCGLFCYDMQGNLQWKYPMVCSKATYGSATSPVIAKDKLILINDNDSDRYLLALNKENGYVVWKTKLPETSVPNDGGQSTPCIYNDKIFVHIAGGICCFSMNDGSLLSRFQLLTKGISSPIIVGDKVVTASWYNFSEADQRGNLPSYVELVKNYDKDLNGKISNAEFPEDMILFQRPEIKEFEGASAPVKSILEIIDNNHDNEITKEEWDTSLEWIKNTFYKPSGLISMNLKSLGEIADSTIHWRVVENIPEVPSPIFYKNRIYMIKDGGILTCVEPNSGKVIYTTRIGNSGSYIASPVAANGYIYIINNNGRMKVVKAGDRYTIAGQYDFKEHISATPAIIGNTIYIRTKTQLLAYSNK